MTEECTINVYLLSLSWKRQQIKTMGVGGGEDEDQKLQTQTNSNKQIVSKFPIKKKQKRRSKQ